MYLGQQQPVNILESLSCNASKLTSLWDSWTAEVSGSLPAKDMVMCKRTDRTFLGKALRAVIFLRVLWQSYTVVDILIF